jgi:non-specific serine/threonine protein kinase/serine/threonine-protein kinase
VELALGQPAGATPLLIEAHELAIRYLGVKDRRTINVGILLGEGLAQTGETTRADRLIADVEPLARSAPDRVVFGVMLRARAITRLNQGRHAEAEADLRGAEVIFRAAGREGAFNLTLLAPLRARIAAAS